MMYNNIMFIFLKFYDQNVVNRYSLTKVIVFNRMFIRLFQANYAKILKEKKSNTTNSWSYK